MYRVTKLQNVKKKGMTQVDILQNLGFSKTYLCIIVQDDGRNLVNKGTFFRDAKGKEVDAIYDITFEKKLNRYAGVIFIRVTQPTGEHFNMRHNVGVLVDKHAVSLPQKVEITNRVKEWLKSK